nr:immunoglobulin heavy chain junction region [Macaca mulatta]
CVRLVVLIRDGDDW